MSLKLKVIIGVIVQFALGTAFLPTSAAAFTERCIDNSYVESCWVRLDASSSKLIVFVHGIDGSGKETWGGVIEGQQVTWPELIASDGLFKDADIFVSDYFSTKWGQSPNITELASGFAGEIRENKALSKDGNGADRYQDVLFVAHSMGGLIVRQALLEDEELAQRTKALFTFATPTGGSQLANWLSILSSSQSLNDLRREFQLQYRLNDEGEPEAVSSSFLRNLRQGWRASGYLETIKSYCAYETLPTEALGFGKIVVEERDALVLCNRTNPLWGAHNDIVKPADGWLGQSLLISWYLDAFPDLGQELEAERPGDIVLVQCSTDFYADHEYALMQEYLSDLSGSISSRVRFSRVLPEDWRDPYLDYIWPSGNSEPSILVLHYSCFQEGAEDEVGWYERYWDNAEFLNSLIPTGAKVVFFSKAFVGASSQDVVKVDGSPGYRFYPDTNRGKIPDQKLRPIREAYFEPDCPRMLSVSSVIKNEEQRGEFEANFKDVVRKLLQSDC
ncbi:esterase/lipase family protein [Leisingera sp. ANG-M7]|uniref:esterase/lipase family protein n=1 Tax=Leisingera sp. ANG-M7 TaxID=1577902 RepID=UPI00057CCDFA|nr:hypothetical protein [Leisingera sp. ANG-M7]KIC35922.1 hypothetical protein RA26_14665 [Leisingera sp. ANG-M7]